MLPFPKWLLLSLALLLGCGTSLDETPSATGGTGGEGEASDTGVGSDAGATDGAVAVPCDPGEIELDGRCTSDRAEACAYVERFSGCVDKDGDCFVESCTLSLPTALYDCDDTRPDVHPLTPERCDGEDNNCDGVADEAFLELGDACVGCAGAGQIECRVSEGETPLACSTDAGQSEAPDLVELCDGVDNDCDDETDEDCQTRLPESWDVESVAVCSQTRAVVSTADGLWELKPNEAPRSLFTGRVVSPTCEEDATAFLALTEASSCVAGTATAPAHCTDAQLVLLAAQEHRTSEGRLGPPRLTGGQLLWHELTPDGPKVYASTATALNARRLLPGTSASDPSEVVDGWLVVRPWTAAGSAGLRLLHLASGATAPINAPAESDAPSLGAGFLVWATPALWAQAWDSGEEPTDLAAQLTEDAALRPTVAGHHAVFLKADSSLWALNLETGAQRRLATALAHPRAFTVSDRTVFWLTEAPELLQATLD